MKLIKDHNLHSSIDAYSPPIVWAIIIFILSSQSSLMSLSVSPLDFVMKKLAHVGVYAVLFFLIDRAITKKHQTQLSFHQKWMMPVFICLLYAVSDEIHQSYVPGRFATLRDVGYDALGVFISLLQKYRYI